MVTNNETLEKSLKNDLLKTVWGNPFGKIAVITTAVLGFVALAGVSFKLGTFTMNNFKDFRTAYKR